MCLYENRDLNEINKLHQKIKSNKLDQKALANFTITDLDSFQFNIIKHINNYRSKCCNSFHLKKKKLLKTKNFIFIKIIKRDGNIF